MNCRRAVNYQWHGFIGNPGLALVLLTYLPLQLEGLESLAYSGLDALGSLFLLLSRCSEFNPSSFTIEIFWLAIGLIGVYKSLTGTPDTGRE